MSSNYLQKEKTENYSFFQVPKMFFAEEKYKGISAEAILLFGLMLDRISLSRENGWIDDNGNVYIYYTIKDIKEVFGCSGAKAIQMLQELTDVDLIDRQRTGLCKPNVIYVKDFTRFQKTEFLNSNNQNSGMLKNRSPDFQKTETNKTKNNKTESNKTNPILSGEDTDKDEEERNLYYELVYENLEADALMERYPCEKEIIESIINLILDTVCSKRKIIRIAGDDKPVQVVKSQFLKLNSMHLEYVLKCLRENTSLVKNVKQYMLATLYNAPNTMESYYKFLVNYDMNDIHKPKN